MALRSPKPSTSPKSPRNASESLYPPVEVLASLASTIYAANPEKGTEWAVSAAHEIWSESLRHSIAPKATSPQQLETLPKKLADQVKAIVGIENSTRAWEEFEAFVLGHQLPDGSLYRGVHPDLRDVCLEMIEQYRTKSDERGISEGKKSRKGKKKPAASLLSLNEFRQLKDGFLQYRGKSPITPKIPDEAASNKKGANPKKAKKRLASKDITMGPDSSDESACSDPISDRRSSIFDRSLGF